MQPYLHQVIAPSFTQMSSAGEALCGETSSGKLNGPFIYRPRYLTGYATHVAWIFITTVWCEIDPSTNFPYTQIFNFTSFYVGGK